MRKAQQWSLAIVLVCALSAVEAAAYAASMFPKNSLVRKRCIACHMPDQNGRLEVIEETRKTPEEWKVVVDRMIAMDGATLDDAEFPPVIKELSKHLCLTPEEMAEVAYLNSDENSQYREIPRSDLEMQIMGACARCHTFGKIKSHRNTLQQWAEVRNLHLGYYPTAVFQMREMDWPKVFKDLLDPLSKLYAFEDPRWHEWMKNRKEQDLTGKWKVAGYQPGLGYYDGAYIFKSDPARGEDEYRIEREVKYENGTTLKMTGEGTLYSEFHLRLSFAATPLTGRVEGVFDLDGSQTGFKGKWWTVVQDSNAYGDETFYKVGGDPRLFAVYPKSIRAADGLKQKITLVGVGLSAKVTEAEIRFSASNVKVSKILKAEDSKIVCQVQAASVASTGPAKLSVKGISCDEAITIFDKIDGIKVLPELGRARVSGGAAYPPQGVQFVARGLSFGSDGKPNTDDDLVLEAVDATWWLEEEATREGDDDLMWLQAPIMNGLYSPVTTYGPIIGRMQNQEGVGLIAVGAAYTEGTRELKGRALLAVTVPDFIPHIK
ncbi:quinohemoprotein amine dehydrogenase subunit alpha [Candidatus Poribacteria bacterium]|nr:quinohemoprotein amine dehydrogenase subunit alpha [Candidatus Poribacteria bacterium]